MYTNKKEIPLTLLKGIIRVKDFLRTKSLDTYLTIDEGAFSFRLTDIAFDLQESNFYFDFYDFTLTNGRPIFSIEFKPENENSLKSGNADVIEDELKIYFNNWLRIVMEYDNQILLPEDNILKSYQEEIYLEFEIIDDDSNSHPFNINQQLYLEKYLVVVNNALDAHKDEEGVQEIINETQDLKSNLTKLTKSEITKKLVTILSKVRKHSLTILKEIYTEAKSELVKSIVNGSFDWVEKHIHLLN